jgi:REP element-mobilizing transposase RayT
VLYFCPIFNQILPSMSRGFRLHHPGSAFHIVSRTQGQEPWFTDDVKDEIADMLLNGVAFAGARPVAFAVMDTHFHIVIFQGRATLGETMQPALRRIALLIQKKQGRIGHVFERRYRARLCQDAEHLPNAILYVHRNPVKAKICRRVTDYRWSSANAFEGNCAPGLLLVDDGLRAFDSTGSASLDALREYYRDRLGRCTDEQLDDYWSWFWQSVRRRSRTAVSYVPRSPHVYREALRDLRDVALVLLRSIDANADVEFVRSRYGGRAIVNVRTQLIAALIQRGYSGVDVARYLRVSETTVSRIRSAMRWSSISIPASMEDGKQVR